MLRYFLLLCPLFLICALRAEDSIEYNKPTPYEFITNVPHSLKDAWNMSFNTQPNTLKAWGAVVGSTALLYYYDEEILSEFQRWGRKAGLGNNDGTRAYIKLGTLSLFRGPADTGSVLYFLGDGWTHAFIGTGFILSGAFTSSNRALQTGSQIFNGMISSTIANQALKRSFGRESPIRKTTPRGAWRPFPSVSTYNNNISKYDAMPSGHIMTATMVFTIIDENYPEERFWLRPFAATWITLLGFQMVNNSVHWASDYPLGIGMGYVFGKVASQYGKKSKTEKETSYWEFYPALYGNNAERTYGLTGIYNF